jgi:LCP family protein required for cell wall assembly
MQPSSAVAVSSNQHPPSETATPLPTATQPALKPTPDNVAQGPDTTPWSSGDHINILLLGGDAGPERSGMRTDTMIVASIHPSTGQAALLSVPRNLKQVPLPEPLASQFPCHCWPDMLNALYPYAEQHRALFPNSPHPGATALQQTIENLLGIRIDHYALVDLSGFVDVIDAIGGVTIDVPERILVRISPPKPGEAWRTFDIPAGRQHLDGEAALAYARNRSDSSDMCA